MLLDYLLDGIQVHHRVTPSIRFAISECSELVRTHRAELLLPYLAGDPVTRPVLKVRNHLIKAGLHVRRKQKHKHKHKPRVNRDDASTSTSARFSFFCLCLRRPGSHVAYACACAFQLYSFLSVFSLHTYYLAHDTTLLLYLGEWSSAWMSISVILESCSHRVIDDIYLTTQFPLPSWARLSR